MLNIANLSELTRFVDYFVPRGALTFGKEYYLYFIALNRDRKPSYRIEPYKLARRIVPWIQAFNQPTDLYFGVNFRTDSETKAVRGDDRVAYYLILDIDGLRWEYQPDRPITLGRKKIPYLIPDRDLTLIQLLTQRSYAPQYIVYSGGGLHLYYAVGMQTPETFTKLCKTAIACLQDVLPVDPKVHDPSRVMRLPGTYNWKYGEPRPCTIVWERNRVYLRGEEGDLESYFNQLAQSIREHGLEYELKARKDSGRKRLVLPKDPIPPKRYTYRIQFSSMEALRDWVKRYPALEPVARQPIVYERNDHCVGMEANREAELLVNTKLPFSRLYLGAVKITQQRDYDRTAPTIDGEQVYDDSMFDLEVELATVSALRPGNATLALMLPYLQRLKRELKATGPIPTETIVAYCVQHLKTSRGNPFHPKNVYKYLQKMERMGLVSRTKRGYIIFSYRKNYQSLQPEMKPRVVRVRSSDWQDLKSMKRTLALLFAVGKKPMQKASIAERLHVHPTTVKRNRKGTPRRWGTELLGDPHQTLDAAKQAARELLVKGCRTVPMKTDSGYQPWRYSAAAAANLIVRYDKQKSRRLRKSLRCKANTSLQGNLVTRISTLPVERKQVDPTQSSQPTKTIRRTRWPKAKRLTTRRVSDARNNGSLISKAEIRKWL